MLELNCSYINCQGMDLFQGLAETPGKEDHENQVSHGGNSLYLPEVQRMNPE